MESVQIGTTTRLNLEQKSIFVAAELYFAKNEVVVKLHEFNGFFSVKDIHGRVVSFGS